MDIRMCRFCRKSFRGFTPLCPECVQQLDDKYILVRNYLDKNEHSDISNVAEETGVDEKSLLYLIREGRLTLKGGDSGPIKCLKCGAPINSGKYCDSCKGKLMKNLESTISAMESKMKPAAAPKNTANTDRKGKMHVLKDE